MRKEKDGEKVRDYLYGEDERLVDSLSLSLSSY